ncbi:hypothetical protein OUZ56_008404 [Daphnia magna]|uniref:Uncharacterized protein n=1 Tax=Daphnia magna TaxID=35525 RepID=A0ABR0ACV8_9CRUS|nr:hypothetical protein OUZ56_008404 [Daphnia magna]
MMKEIQGPKRTSDSANTEGSTRSCGSKGKQQRRAPALSFPPTFSSSYTSTCCGYLELREALAVAASTGAPLDFFPNTVRPTSLSSYYFC